MTSILVLHALTAGSRLTTVNHAVFPARHWYGADVYFKNVFGALGEIKSQLHFDIGIVTYETLALRNLPYWREVRDIIATWLAKCRIRVAFPQDEFTNSRAVDEFMVRANIDNILTPITRDLDLLYPKSLGAGIRIAEAMNGYWEPSNLSVERPTVENFVSRARDVSQRVAALPPVFGNFGHRKSQIAHRFAQEASQRGFTCDISSQRSSVLTGYSWFQFLRDTRFTIGSRAGSSRLDPSGCRTQKSLRLPIVFPRVSWDMQYRLLRVRGLPKGDFTSVSPRVLESAGAGVCQVLENDTYFPNFDPWVHYIPIDAEMKQAEFAFNVMRDSERCTVIAQNAFDFLIASQDFSYSQLVRKLQGLCDLSEPLTQVRPSATDLDDHGSSAGSVSFKARPRHPNESLIESSLINWTPASYWLKQ